MKTTPSPVQALATCLALATVLFASGSWAQTTAPAQKSLLTSASGARANVTLILDNSGSMAWPYTDKYGVSSSTSTNTAATNGRFTNPWLAQRASEVNALYYNPRFTYEARVNASNNPLNSAVDGVAKNGIFVPPNAAFVSNPGSAGVFYNTTSPSDAPHWDAAANTRNAFYAEDIINTAIAPCTGYCLFGYGKEHPRHTRWVPDANGVEKDFNGNVLANTAPIPSFVYMVCGPLTANEPNPPTVVKDASGQFTNCNFNAAQAQVDASGKVTGGSHVRIITRNSNQLITLPYDHERTECGVGATTCTNAQEITNIVNWYKYYGTRADATATSIGLALASDNLQGGLRLGYYNINRQANINTEQLGVANAPARLRGVRLHDAGANAQDTNNVYAWLYGLGSTPRGGTPLHTPLIRAAEYYRTTSQAGQTENPYLTNPAAPANATTNPELSCRRSFAVVFSDGAWTPGYGAMPPGTNGVTNFVSSTAAPLFTGTSNGVAVSRQYSPTGPTPSTVITRKDYTPYGAAATRSNGMADVAAYYNWFIDLRPDLPNNISTRPGKPAFWQNMTTYTVGYLVRPSGEGTTTGLSYNQINAYRTAFLTNGLGAGTVTPAWPTVDLSTATEPTRIDDFIHAGYAGGARSFSVNTPAQIKQAFDTIFAETTDSTGDSAGVSVSLSSSSAAASSDSVKYTTQYATGNNSGDVVAWSLDANGAIVDTNTTDTVVPTSLWSAKDRLNSNIVTNAGVTWRRLFTRTASDPVVLHDGTANVVAPSAPVMSALDPTGYFPTAGQEMVRYLLGDDARFNRAGLLLRQRQSLVGASVNSSPLLLTNNQDMAYYYPPIKTVTDANNVETAVIDADLDIEGRSTYKTLLTAKGAFPPVVMSANNSGTVQVFNAAKITTPSTGETDLTPLGGGSRIRAGEELAAFMPLGVGSKLRKVSDEAFAFEYLLDGRMTEEDIYDSSATAGPADKWRQIVVGTSGRATMGTMDFANPPTAGSGRFIYALNSPFIEEGSTKKRIPSASDFLWEKSWPDLGYVTNATTAGQLSAQAGSTEKNQWVVLSNSGHYAAKSGLYVLNALTGAQVGFIPTTGSGDGLSGVVAVRDANRRIIAAYAGDAAGNLWRFNLTGTWSATKMYTTSPVRPIYAAPTVQLARGGKRIKTDGTGEETCSTEVLDGKCGTIVVFGTGMLLQDTDRSNTQTQSIYGIWDPTPLDATKTDIWKPSNAGILTQTIDLSSQTAGASTSSTVKNIDQLYKTSSNPIDYTATHMGWKLDLGKITTAGNATYTAGERVLTDVNNIGRSVLITTTVVTAAGDSLESCGSSGTANPNVTYVLRAQDGSSVAGFRDTKGKIKNFSVGLSTTGGFDNAILAGRSGSGDGSSATAVFNPYAVGKTNESIVDPTTSMTECTRTTGENVSKNDTSTVDGCIPGEWQRTWRQLTAPPQ